MAALQIGDGVLVIELTLRAAAAGSPTDSQLDDIARGKRYGWETAELTICNARIQTVTGRLGIGR